MFTKRIQPNGYKAMVVAVSREAAVTYKRELDRLNAPRSKKKVRIKRAGMNIIYSSEQREIEADKFKSPEDVTNLAHIMILEKHS